MTTQTQHKIKSLATSYRTLTNANDALASIAKLLTAAPEPAAHPCPSCGASRSAPAGTCPACGRNPAANKTGGKLTRAAFTALSPAARSRHIKSGGTLIS